MDDAERVGRDHGEFMIGQVDDLVGVADQRRGVAGDEVLAVADADHQRAAQPRGDDHVGPIAEHDGQAIGAAKLQQRGLHRVDQRREGIGASSGSAGELFAVRSAIRWAMTSVSVALLERHSPRSMQLLP